MTASPSSGTRAPGPLRGAVLGRGKGIAGTVYGTVVVMAALVAAAAAVEIGSWLLPSAAPHW